MVGPILSIIFLFQGRIMVCTLQIFRQIIPMKKQKSPELPMVDGKSMLNLREFLQCGAPQL